MVSLDDKNIGFKVFLGLLIILIVYIIMSYITIRLNYKPTFDWWTTNNGKQYDKYFSVFSLIAVSYSSILYYLSSIFSAPIYKLNIDQYRFINAEILPYLRYTDDSGKQNGLLTPKSLCETVLLSTDDNDDLFNNFLRLGRVIDGKRYSIKTTEPLTYTRSKETKTTTDGKIYYTYTVNTIKDDSTTTGLYPVSTEDWKGLIGEWMGDDWAWVFSSTSNFYSVQSIKDGATYEKWFENKTGRGDNFLARMGIIPQAPLVEAFINDVYNIDSLQLDATAMSNLIGRKGQNDGGWLGYLQGLSKDDLDTYTNIIRSKLNVKGDPPTPPCTPNNPGKGGAAALTSLLSGITSMAFVSENPVAMVVIGLASITSAVVSGMSAAKGTC